VKYRKKEGGRAWGDASPLYNKGKEGTFKEEKRTMERSLRDAIGLKTRRKREKRKKVGGGLNSQIEGIRKRRGKDFRKGKGGGGKKSWEAFRCETDERLIQKKGRESGRGSERKA